MRRLSGEKCFFGENVLPEFITLWFPHRWVEMGGGEEQVLEKAAVAVDKVEDFFSFEEKQHYPVLDHYPSYNNNVRAHSGRSSVGSSADRYLDRLWKRFPASQRASWGLS